MDAHFLEHAAVHDRHFTAAVGRAAVIGAAPARASESAHRVRRQHGTGRQSILQRLECRADFVAQSFAPGLHARLTRFEQTGIH